VVVTVLRDAHCTAEFAQRVFRRGARGVVPRHAEPAQIVQAIHNTPISRRYVDPTLAPLLAAADTDGQPPACMLTRREFEVLQLIADGLENRAIASALFVSVETVRTHIKGMLRKLGARDRAHAVAISYRIGLLVAGTDR
jgi:DNA-binding NarL/FixJ family response regulator